MFFFFSFPITLFYYQITPIDGERSGSDGLHSVWPRADEKAQSHVSDNGVIAVS